MRIQVVEVMRIGFDNALEVLQTMPSRGECIERLII